MALQGAFAEHLKTLSNLGVECFEVRKPTNLDQGIDALVIPGGESTVMGKLLKETGLYGPLKALIDGGMPVLGTCAGMILLADTIEDDTTVHFGALPITVRRNAFGRQLGSFHTVGEFAGIAQIPMTFIRAPVITKADISVDVLATVGDHTVAARRGNILVTAFHPELTDEPTVHSYFMNLVKGAS